MEFCEPIQADVGPDEFTITHRCVVTPERLTFVCTCGETFPDEAAWRAHVGREHPRVHGARACAALRIVGGWSVAFAVKEACR